ncbi:uncharacterized protein DUF4399 [Marinobacterium mangrovicola]|uniref:Uncharacterized protein DUF4399 n=2 Tax=Marinobacterium mangrovicola TaxID=1476959 RepID=A0A4R1G3S0_9GAMM|nr:uncharacterized protein DUF4399 [Marinobacterium mangrovicola]
MLWTRNKRVLDTDKRALRILLRAAQTRLEPAQLLKLAQVASADYLAKVGSVQLRLSPHQNVTQHHPGYGRLIMKKLLATAGLTALLSTSVFAASSPEGAEAYIVSPSDGATVPATFTVTFGLKGMGVAPAGTDKENTGHHHLLIDGELPPMDAPMGDQVKHFGGGQTETELTLEPGTHTLQLILGDMAHQPHDPPVVSEKITITVE